MGVQVLGGLGVCAHIGVSQGEGRGAISDTSEMFEGDEPNLHESDAGDSC